MTDPEGTTASELAARIDPKRAALFFDFDGVLVDLASTPDTITVPDGLPALLEQLQTAANGALAIVTGRPVADLRRHLPDAPSRVIGSHGAEWCKDGETVTRVTLKDPGMVARMQMHLHTIAGSDDRLIAEDKPLGAVLHYRRAPELGEGLRSTVAALAENYPEFELHPAKMALELRPRCVGKDRAVMDLMAQAPFAGRLPVYFGDDTTDEPALAWVRAQDGISVKVGPGQTMAAYRLGSAKDVAQLLAQVIPATSKHATKPTDPETTP